MGEDIKQSADAVSGELSTRVEVGADSQQGGKEADQELRNEDEKKASLEQNLYKKPHVPLFMRGTSEGPKGNAQDEKDGAEE